MDGQSSKAVTTAVQAIFRVTDGILLGYANVTTADALDTITDGSLAAGCIIIAATSNAVNTVQVMINEGVSTAPAFKSFISVGGIDPDA